MMPPFSLDPVSLFECVFVLMMRKKEVCVISSGKWALTSCKKEG